MPYRLKQILVLVLVAFCSSFVDAADQRLMSNAEYVAYLDRLFLVLPRWEDRVKQIDAAKVPNVSYSPGKERNGSANARSDGTRAPPRLDRSRT